MSITYRTDARPTAEQIIDLYKSSGLNRPVDDAARIQKMYDFSNLIVTAWDGDLLVGVSRTLSDYCYCCYLSDLAVREEYKHAGIGKKLIELTKEESGGEKCTLILLSAPAAMGYYPKIGMENVDNCFLIKRSV